MIRYKLKMKILVFNKNYKLEKFKKILLLMINVLFLNLKLHKMNCL